MNQNEGFVQNWSYEGIVSRLLKRQSDSRGLQINDYDKEFFIKRKTLPVTVRAGESFIIPELPDLLLFLPALLPPESGRQLFQPAFLAYHL